MQHLNAPFPGQCSGRCRPSDASIISLSKTFAFHLIPPSRTKWVWFEQSRVAGLGHIRCIRVQTRKAARRAGLEARLESGMAVAAETHGTEFISQFPLQFRKLNEKALKNIQKQQPGSQAARQPCPVTPVAPVAKNNVTKAEPARCRISSKKGKRTTSGAKGNLTNKTEVNLLRKPKSMAQPHPVKRWAATRAEKLKGGDGGKDGASR